jgi:hypothetical protein
VSGSRPSRRLERLLICEGPEDRLFFGRLIEARSDLPKFHIVDAGGNGGFSSAINKFRVDKTSVFNSLREILIVADNDDDPRGNFEEVCSHIERVFGPKSAPSGPLVKVRSTATRSASITVMMVPWENEHGSLERMCVEAARSTDRKIGTDVDHFLSTIHADRWKSETRFNKAWLRTNLAVRCERDPFVALGHIFSDNHHYGLIPVDHPSLDRIAGELRKL